MRKKNGLLGRFLFSLRSGLRNPGLDFISPILGLPLFKQAMVAALGFDDLAVMRILVLLQLAWPTSRFLRGTRSSDTAVELRIQKINDVPQAEAVLSQ